MMLSMGLLLVTSVAAEGTCPGAGNCYPAVHPQYGIPPVTEETCHAQGCCWDGSNCSFPNTGAPPASQCSAARSTIGMRLPCYSSGLYAPASQGECEQRGCCFDSSASPENTENPTRCFFPTLPVLYTLDEQSKVSTANGFTAFISLQPGYRGPFGNDAAMLILNVTFVSNSIIRITIRNASATRWEVPNILQPMPADTDNTARDYSVSYTTAPAPFSVTVTRISTNEVLFDSGQFGPLGQLGGLVYENQFLQISTMLGESSPNIFGLGGHVSNFRLPVTPWQRYTMFSAYAFAYTPHEPQGGNPSYGEHPFYMQIRESSQLAHGVFFLTSNPMEVIMQSINVESDDQASLTYRVNGGILDIFVMLGPSPAEVMNQYTDLIGKPFLVPYWSLGYHLCRYGYDTLNNTKAVVAGMRSRNVPHDTQWNDIDYMYKQMDFTTSPGRYPIDELGAFVDELHTLGMHYVDIVDPAPAVDMTVPPEAQATAKAAAAAGYLPGATLLQSGGYVHSADGSPLKGVVWPNANVSFPDFLNPDTVQWWGEQMAAFRSRVDFDGKWTDMNEPQNFCYGGEQPYACRHIAGFTETYNETGVGWYAFPPNNFTKENGIAAIKNSGTCLDEPRGPGTAPPPSILTAGAGTDGLLYTPMPYYDTAYSEKQGVLYPFDAMRQPWLPGQMAYPQGVNPQGALNMVCAGISYNLLAASALQKPTLRYNAHSLYGWSEMVATYQALLKSRKGKRPFVLSRSTFPGSGVWGGHWLGDNIATWANLRQATAGLLNMGLFGIPMVGTDLCGFFGVTTPQLCIRWQQAGAFYPFMRNHNVRSGPGPNANDMYTAPPPGPAPYPSTPFIPPQAPSQFLPNATAIMRDALLTRYALLPYIYTKMVSGAHVRGAPLMRPIFFEFPSDTNTYGLGCRNNCWEPQCCSGMQWMFGDALLVTPVLVEDADNVTGYFPNLATAASGGWFDLLTGLSVRSAATRTSTSSSTPSSNWTTLEVPITSVPVHIRAGSIVPMQDPCQGGAFDASAQTAPFALRSTTLGNCSTTTTAARLQDFSLLLALDGQTASGSLYWDDGDDVAALSGAFLNISFSSSCSDSSCQSGVLEGSMQHSPNSEFSPPPPLTKLVLYGVTAGNGQQLELVSAGGTVRSKAVQNSTHSFVVFSNVQISMVGDFHVSWSPSAAGKGIPAVGVVFLCLAGMGAMVGGMCLIHKRASAYETL